MIRDDFAVFILTYGRANKVITHKTLKEAGYTGKIYTVCSTDDTSIDEYKKLYKDNVLTFNKDDYVDDFDIGDNFSDMRVVVYARNALFDIAERIGVKYFLVLDDDYTAFNYRFDDKGDYCTTKIRQNLDNIFTSIIDYYKTIPALSIALAQGGDFIGGSESSLAQTIKIKRKIMNSFFCSTERRFKFVGRINEDVNTYVSLGNVGKLMFQTNQLSIEQRATQSNSGGLTEFYLDKGTYIKSFYTIIYAPSCCKIGLMGNTNKRLHHVVQWKNAVSMILDAKYKKL